MPPKQKKTFHQTIKSVEQFEELTSNEAEGPLVIIDTHLDWCGPCVCMETNYPVIWYSYDVPEQRLSFWQCCEGNLPEEVKTKLALECKPRFLIYK